MDTVGKMSRYVKEHQMDVKVIGIPKTIDNDLVVTDHTPGFGSAARYVAASVLEMAHDTYIYNTKSVLIAEIMGRDAGWLTAASVLARNSYSRAPHLIYLPEVAFDKEQFITDLKEMVKKYKNVIVAVSEGIRDKDGNDLYPEIRRRAKEKNASEKHHDMVRFDYIEKLGYYCTESSEHNAEYNPFYIKARYPELIDRFNIPLDEYPRRCIRQIAEWDKEYADLSSKGVLPHERSKEYASRIIEAMVTGRPYKLGGNVLNTGGLIENLPREACVEVPCLVDGAGVAPCYVGRLPVQLAAMNQTHVNVHLLTIEAAATKKREHIYHAAMLEPHTAAELSLDDIIRLVDDLIEAHGSWLPQYR